MSKRRKEISIIIGTIILGCVMMLLIQSIYVKSYMESFRADMELGLEASELSYEDMLEKDNMYQGETVRLMDSLAGYASYYLEKYGINNSSINDLVADIGLYCVVDYYWGSIDDNKQINMGSVKHDPRNFNEEQLTEFYGEYTPLTSSQYYELLKNGRYTNGVVEYTAKPVKNKGYVILEWMTDSIIQHQSVMAAYTSERDEEMMRINLNTGIIEDSSLPELVGTNAVDYLDLPMVRGLNDETFYRTRLLNNKLVYMIVDIVDDQLFVSYVDRITSQLNIVRSVILPIVLGWLFMIMILVYSLKFTNITNNESGKIKYVRVFGKRYIDGKLISHVNGMSFFAVLLIVMSMIYVQTLINYSNQNINADKDLKSLNYFIELNADNVKTFEQDYDNEQKIIVDVIANYYMRYPKELSVASLQDLRNRMTSVYDIAFYDEHGTCVCNSGGSSAGYSNGSEIGYTLSSDENSVESVCWNILNGRMDYEHYYSETGSIEYYECKKRMDANGLIRVSSHADVIQRFKESSSVDTLVASAYFGAATKLYIDKKYPDVVNVYEGGNATGYTSKNTLPEIILDESFSGIVKFQGMKFYINSLVCNNVDIVIMSAIKAMALSGLYNPVIILAIIATFILQVVVLVIGMSVKLNNSPNVEMRKIVNIQVKETLDEQLMDEKFRSVVKNMFYSTCVMILVLLGVDSLFGNTSLLSYLFSNDWAKGINLFSVTIILMMIAGAILGGGILQSLVLFFTKNMGPRGATIGRMVSSLIKFMILVVVLVSVLVDIGIDPSKLLAGAGIAGALISFCAQQTVNDFLSGFFIVFEGLFNIGDWITVNGFRGQVIEIGIRTTKIAVGGNVQIVNNSELKTITLMAPNGMGAICTIDIAYKEDVDRVIELINDNAAMYTEAIPAIVEGPYVDGVVEFGLSGVTLYLWALADQERVRAVERDMRKVTKEIFDKNGIEIPFNQVTIHTAE